MTSVTDNFETATLFSKVARSRYSVRQFLSTPIDEEVIDDVLRDAQCSPSNCNTQPWLMHIVSGAKRDALSKALLLAAEQGRYSLDFPFDQADYKGRCAERLQQQGKAFYESLGIAREDQAARQATVMRNLEFYGAPHVALLFIPDYGSERIAADAGMYAQTFMLGLTARGLGSVPQTLLGMFADTARETLDISVSQKLLFGISFGHPDEARSGTSLRMSRDSVESCVEFHR